MVAFDTKYIFVIRKFASAVWALFHKLSGYVLNIYPASPFFTYFYTKVVTDKHNVHCNIKSLTYL